ncbi:MAG TPA: Rid family hydrolase [Acidobacteriaceae bacterium]
MASFRTAVARVVVPAAFAIASISAVGQAPTRIPLPNNSPFPISQGVWVGNTLYLSGALDPDFSKAPAKDTKTQTVGALQAIQKSLAAQKLTLGDVVMMHVYLAADPATGKMDFAGFMGGYTQFFGTKDQPNKPARSAMQVAALAAPGALVEIEVIAVKP